jgi:hypothetical protein
VARHDDPVIFGAASGRLLEPDFPPGVVAIPQAHEIATPKALAAARRMYAQRELSEFEVVERDSGSPIFFDRATGAQYKRDAAAVLLSPTPLAGVECFVVDAANTLHFLRRRGPREPERTTPISFGTIWGRVE